MIDLPNSCFRSKFNVFPKNYLDKGADVTLTWYIKYRFHDPLFKENYPNGKQVVVKSGINGLSTVSDKRKMIKHFLDKIDKHLTDGYNPITEKVTAQLDPLHIEEEETDKEGNVLRVLPTTPFIKALRFALTRVHNVIEAKHDIKSILKYLEEAAIILNLDQMPIDKVKSGHIKLCLDYLMSTRKTFTAKRFNKARAYLMGLYKKLIEANATSVNAPRDVILIVLKPTKREVLSPEDIKRVKKYLWDYNRPFYNFMMLFFYSGGRVKELMTLKGKGVDLVKQTYTTEIKKGNQGDVARTIRDKSLPLWKDQMENCKPNDYVFSKNLLPGPTPISSRQVTIRWKRYVKKPLDITADFYSLKHLSIEATVKAYGLKVAAGQAGHMSTEMAKKVYAYGEADRIHEANKEADITL